MGTDVGPMVIALHGFTNRPAECEWLRSGAGQEVQTLEIYISRCRTKRPSLELGGPFFVKAGHAAALTGMGGLSTEVMGMVSTMEGE